MRDTLANCTPIKLVGVVGGWGQKPTDWPSSSTSALELLILIFIFYLFF